MTEQPFCDTAEKINQPRQIQQLVRKCFGDPILFHEKTVKGHPQLYEIWFQHGHGPHLNVKAQTLFQAATIALEMNPPPRQPLMSLDEARKLLEHLA